MLDLAQARRELAQMQTENESLRRSRHEAEDQLCRIAAYLGGDARQAPGDDKTIAGLAIETVKRLREALSWAVGYIRCQKPNAEVDYPDMRNAAALADAAPLYSGEFHRMMCRAEVAEEELRRLRALLCQTLG